jgi:hypothetical protein
MALLLSTLAVAVLFGTVHAKPSVPEFTVKLVANPYYVPPAYEIDPYTGENVTIHSGYTVENKSIVFTIKTQPFTPYTDADGNLIELYYKIRAKGHFEEYWTELGHINSSDSEYVTASYALGADANKEILREITIGDTVDFQVAAIYGHFYNELAGRPILPLWRLATDETSGWSETQTLTIDESQTPTPSPATTPTPPPTSTPYQEPQQTEQEIIIGAAIAVAVIGAGLGLLIYLIKRK